MHIHSDNARISNLKISTPLLISPLPHHSPSQSFTFSQSSTTCADHTASTTMASTIPTMAMLNPKCLATKTPSQLFPPRPLKKPISLPSLQNQLPTTQRVSFDPSILLGTTLAGAIFTSLSCCESALALQQIADIAEGDNRGLALLLPIIPAILWVLYNIFQPALNQLNKMSSSKGVIVGLGLGLGAWAASGFFSTPNVEASEVAMLADATSSDSRGLLLLFVITPAIGWVLFNILQPALNQLNRMRT